MKVDYVKLALFSATLIAMLSLPLAVEAQVTIGSGLKPNDGALLDLKEFQTTDGSANSTKGLLLPRVTLETPIQLAPIADDTADKISYAGMTVFNVEKTGVTCNLMGLGLYTWDGKIWQNLTPNASSGQTKWVENADGETGVLTDFEGNTYTARKFGNAWWTTQNSRSTLSSNGQPLYDPEDPYADYGARINPALESDPSTIGALIAQCPQDLLKPGTISYLESVTSANVGDPNNQNQTIKDYTKKFGLLYTGTTSLMTCPIGWRLPSNNDWLNLITLFDSNGIAAGNIAGAKMRANNYHYRGLNGNGTIYKWGVNDPADTTLEGFDAYTTGFILADGKRTSGFGLSAFWWSSDNHDVHRLLASSPGIERVQLNKYYYVAVRCVKD